MGCISFNYAPRFFHCSNRILAELCSTRFSVQHNSWASAVFDGCAMIARFKIDGGSEQSRPSVVVSHRFIETTYLAAARAAGGDVRWTLGHKSGVRRTALERLKYIASLSASALVHGVHLGDNALISIFPGAATTASGKKELIAHTETLSGTYRIDPDTLETLGRVEYTEGEGQGGGEKRKEGDADSEEVSGLGKTAHPHALPNGDVINLACDFMPVASKDAGARLFRPPHMTLYRNPGGDPSRRQAIAHIPYLRPSSPTWVHQVAVSHNYAVIVQNPCFYGIDNMVFGENSGEYLVFRWDPSAGSLIHVVPLDTNLENKNDKKIHPRLNRIKSFRAPAFLATHWINAFESDTKGLPGRSTDGIDVGSDGTTTKTPIASGRYLNLDGCMTKDPRLMAHWSLDTVRSGLVGGKQIDVSFMRRLVIDLDAPDGTFLGDKVNIKEYNANKNVLNDGSLLQKLIPDEAHGYAIELPAINNKFSGRQHQFVYAAAAKRPSNCWNALTKADVVHGTVKMWYEAGAVCWEPLFVPRPGAVEEDDGVVLAVIMQADGKSALLVLDGKDFSEIARAVLPYGLSNGFHGCFVPEE
ncbi:hypothetical protein KSW81_002692 [Nannochloris sp. 'desiccata']|nr:hypothetical protein KSW81_002692 [Chlorella desiccata (nom. nud.)]